MVNILGYTAGSALSTSIERRGPMGPQGRAGAQGAKGDQGPAGEKGPAGIQGAKGEQGSVSLAAGPLLTDEIILQPDGGLQTNDSGLSLAPMTLMWSDAGGSSVSGESYRLYHSIKDFRIIIATVLLNSDPKVVQTAVLMPQTLKFGSPPAFGRSIEWRVFESVQRDRGRRVNVIITFTGWTLTAMTTMHSSETWSVYSLYGQR